MIEKEYYRREMIFLIGISLLLVGIYHFLPLFLWKKAIFHKKSKNIEKRQYFMLTSGKYNDIIKIQIRIWKVGVVWR